jgi:hypothetical protein
MIGMWWLGELVAGDYILPYDEFYADDSGRFPSFDVEDELPGCGRSASTTASSTSSPTTPMASASTIAATC